MLTGPTRTISLAILAAVVAASTQAQAHSSRCTPAHLTSALKQVEAACGSAKIVSAHRPGARIRGTGRVSQHAACDGTHGAIDAVFSNRACALSALRKTNYTILTYGKSAHIHIGTDGWRNGANTNVAHRNTANMRVASRQRAGARYASRQRATVRTARARSAGEQNAWGNATWSDGGDTRSVYAQRSGGRSAARQRGTRVAARQRSSEQNGWDNANWSDASWSGNGAAERAYAQRPGRRTASRQRGVRMASRQGSRHQNGWGDAQWSGSNWTSNH